MTTTLLLILLLGPLALPFLPLRRRAALRVADRRRKDQP
jgi:hypothetical protein